MQGIVDGLLFEGHSDLWLVSLNISFETSDDILALYNANTVGPVLQDLEEDPVQTLLGGSYAAVWVVDHEGRPRYQHLTVSFPDDVVNLEAELRCLLEQATR